MPKRKSPDAYEVTPELVARVEAMAATGLTIEQIAHCLDWCPDALYRKKKAHKELQEAIKRGQNKGIATITNSLFQNAKGGNLGAQIFYLKNRAGWSDKQEHEVTGKGGGPVSIDWSVESVSVSAKDES